ncbi:molybdenum ABC transporter, periplasmic molybdate-binding protein [Sulfurimonas gotlandica GD1]|uniref:Molybdenum ABC transporter, periplasmic molybdate-binding protein n=1 Tax=Sulfurimonas gotlandica (strain DSM 19862 / JCM 16533 / GD1) TaxID=929558 RepID=B6BI32_SULGG|nr:molybdate ABC transporter substrate-binding protein [Sulfurimonas gotlandica]EDZ63512.1 molybdate ABC transporter, periplasmic molybdate-binding protein [Sulfurimonas gotlandica GD1]EHP30185.1 molybdenum ABC transporter, periplasmic molybdate-binding protein [Sulfurimonas gotlandica GD1]
MKRLFILLLLGISLVNAGTISIAVAANVSYAIEDLKKEFNKTNPETKVRVTLGSSGKLTAQIKHGAPYQIFMSANMKYPQALYQEKIAITEPVVYALGSLAILSNKKRDLSDGIYILQSKEVSKVAIANPKTAPYGIAAMQAITNAKFEDDVKSKFVYGESISQTVSYAVTAADVGIIAKSSLYSPNMSQYKENINWISIDSKLYTPIQQGIVMLKDDKEVKAFYDFILSDDAKKIFKEYGYLLP